MSMAQWLLIACVWAGGALSSWALVRDYERERRSDADVRWLPGVVVVVARLVVAATVICLVEVCT